MRLIHILFLVLGLPSRAFKYHYGSLYRREIKKRFRIRGLVEDHHVIPNEFRKHPVVIKYKYNNIFNYL